MHSCRDERSAILWRYCAFCTICSLRTPASCDSVHDSWCRAHDDHQSGSYRRLRAAQYCCPRTLQLLWPGHFRVGRSITLHARRALCLYWSAIYVLCQKATIFPWSVPLSGSNRILQLQIRFCKSVYVNGAGQRRDQSGLLSHGSFFLGTRTLVLQVAMRALMAGQFDAVYGPRVNGSRWARFSRSSPRQPYGSCRNAATVRASPCDPSDHIDCTSSMGESCYTCILCAINKTSPSQSARFYPGLKILAILRRPALQPEVEPGPWVAIQ